MAASRTEQSGPITSLYYDVKNGWEQWFFLTSDNHFDSIYCNREKMQADFEEAKRRRARIMIFGDWFDAMQGRFDKRRAPSELRSEYLVDDYYDRVVLDSAEWLSPYAKYIDIIADGNHECVDDQTDVLTKNGWKSIKDVTLDDEVLSIQNWDQVALFAKPLKTHAYEHHGDMIHVKHKKLDMYMTPDHRVAYIPQKANYIHYTTANHLCSQMEIPVSVDLEQSEYPLSDDEIRFAAWILTDGSLSHGSHDIYQSKHVMIERIEQLLIRLGLKYSKSKRQRNTSRIVDKKLLKIPLPEIMFRVLLESREYANSIIYEKGKLPEWSFQLSKRQFDIFLDELILGDGSIEKRSESAKVMYGEKCFLDDLQRACVQNGYRANISKRNRNGEVSYFALNITEHKTIEVKKLHNHSFTEHFDGMVYCLTTVTGNFFVRRNGTVYLTGNCSVLKNANTNLPGNLVHDLNVQHKTQIHHGGYGGWVRIMINLSGGEQTGPRTSVKLKYFHGAGGEAPVTRGAIQTNRQAVYLPDADIVVNGHSHNNYIIPITRERLSNKGQQYFDNQYHIRIPGYKQGYGDGTTGWEVTRGGVPKPIGSVFVRLKYLCVGNNRTIHVYPSEELISPPEPVSVDAAAVYDGPVYDDDQEGY